jgi:hypothetical protein
MSMTFDLDEEYTPLDKLWVASKYHHSWGHEVPLRPSCPDIHRACLVGATCGNYGDPEGSAASCAGDGMGMLGLEGNGHNVHNNRSAVAELALLETRFVSIGSVYLIARHQSAGHGLRGCDQFYLG